MRRLGSEQDSDLDMSAGTCMGELAKSQNYDFWLQACDVLGVRRDERGFMGLSPKVAKRVYLHEDSFSRSLSPTDAKPRIPTLGRKPLKKRLGEYPVVRCSWQNVFCCLVACLRVPASRRVDAPGLLQVLSQGEVLRVASA